MVTDTHKESIQKEELAILGQNTAEVLHEIKNPLAGISSVAQVLKGKLAAGSKEAECVQIILKEVARLSFLTKNFLDFAKLPEPRFEPFDLCQIIDQSLQLAEAGFQKGQFDKDLDLPDRYLLKGDKDQVMQALQNIFLNAFEAMGHKGCLRVQWLEGCKQLIICDDGPGMDAQTLDRLFEPFFSTKKKGKGVGMAITRKIFQAHGWHIHVDSSLGQGCRFVIKLG